MRRIAVKYVKGGELIYDYGCGAKPYSVLFATGSGRYVGFDLQSNPAADDFLDERYCMPVSDASCQIVLSTQVLEHVPSAAKYLSECSRVLQQGGLLILSTHGFFNYHGCPEDFRRWTLYGLKYELEQTGFRIIESVAVLPGWACAIQLLQHQITRGLPRVLKGAIFLGFQLILALFASKPKWKAVDAVDACVFVLVAKKA